VKIATTIGAVGSLDRVIADRAAPNTSRAHVGVRAADSVLDHSKQAIEIEDVEVRVTALEQAAEFHKSG